MNLFKQYSDFTIPTSDLLGADATEVVSEASIQGMSATYHVTLLDTGPNVSVISQNFFSFLPQKPKLLKSHTHTVTLASGANLGPIHQCHLTFKLGNKCFTDKFIVLKFMQRNLILGLNWQSNYKIGCNWNVTGQQHITYKSEYLCVSILLTDAKPIIHNAGAFF